MLRIPGPVNVIDMQRVKVDELFNIENEAVLVRDPALRLRTGAKFDAAGDL